MRRASRSENQETLWCMVAKKIGIQNIMHNSILVCISCKRRVVNALASFHSGCSDEKLLFFILA